MRKNKFTNSGASLVARTSFSEAAFAEDCTRVPIVEPERGEEAETENYIRNKFQQFLRLCVAEGISPVDVQRLIVGDFIEDRERDVRTAVCVLATELAASQNREFFSDVLLYATRMDFFEGKSMRQYSAKHGCSVEWFSRKVEACQQRLGLPPRSDQHTARNYHLSESTQNPFFMLRQLQAANRAVKIHSAAADSWSPEACSDLLQRHRSLVEFIVMLQRRSAVSEPLAKAVDRCR